MTDRAGLAGETAAIDVYHDVIAGNLGQFQGLTNGHFEGFITEIVVDIAAIDDDFACLLYTSRCV